jgi:hypothetical protein
VTDKVLQLCVLECATRPAGAVNDDVIGCAGNVAWVIDGATDIGDEPLVDPLSDAAWLARTVGDWFTANADALPANLEEIVPGLTEHVAQKFARLHHRPPVGRFEHPSAAGLAIRLEGAELAYLSVGDCTLLVQTPGGATVRYGVAEDEAGDAWLAQHLSTAAASPHGDAATLRAGLLPVLRQARERMNLSPGYGVFSITAPPPDYVLSGRVPLAAGTRILLASDGFMRLVDVFNLFTVDALLDATIERGVAAMIDILREAEQSDAACRRFARAKCSDDASALLATVGPGLD